MENDGIKIYQRIHTLIHELFPVVTGEDAECQILDAISDELLKEMGEIENYDEVKKALINMFLVGRMFPEEIKKTED